VTNFGDDTENIHTTTRMRCPHPGCGMDIFIVVTSNLQHFPQTADGQVNFNTSWRGEGADVSKEASTQFGTKLREGREHFGYYHPGARFPPSLVRDRCPGIENFHKMCLATRDDPMVDPDPFQGVNYLEKRERPPQASQPICGRRG
jgi:hypothetical protein